MNRRPAGAFSLPEVLVSLVIFAMAALVLAAAYLNVINSYAVVHRGGSYDPDVAFARQQLLTQPDLATAEAGQQFDTADNRHLTWSADIEPTSTSDLFTVTLTCTIDDPAKKAPQKAVQTFMLLRPTWSDPTAQSQLRQAAADRITQFQQQMKGP